MFQEIFRKTTMLFLDIPNQILLYLTNQYQNYADEKWLENTIRIKDKNNKLVRAKDEKGNYIQRDKENKGVLMHDVFTDISWGATNKERTGYPTQKPLALLDRIIKASSKEGDIVFDPFVVVLRLALLLNS